MLNNRNWVDITFTVPAGWKLDKASITDLAAEFVLGGPGVGSLVLDPARAPTLRDTTATTYTFRYWLLGRRGVGNITATYLPSTWSYSRPPAPPT